MRLALILGAAFVVSCVPDDFVLVPAPGTYPLSTSTLTRTSSTCAPEPGVRIAIEHPPALDCVRYDWLTGLGTFDCADETSAEAIRYRVEEEFSVRNAAFRVVGEYRAVGLGDWIRGKYRIEYFGSPACTEAYSFLARRSDFRINMLHDCDSSDDGWVCEPEIRCTQKEDCLFSGETCISGLCVPAGGGE